VKLLFNSHGGLGDELCCTPTYRVLSKDGHIVYVNPLYNDLYKNSPYVRIWNGESVDKTIDMKWFSEVGYGYDMHLIDFYAHQAGIEVTDRSLDIFPTEDNLKFAKELIAGLPRPIVMYNTFHGWVARGALSISNLRAIEKMKVTLVRIGDRPPWEGIGYNLVGYTGDILGTAALLSLVDVYVGNDSGLAHVAGAVGCKSVVLYASTDPELRKHPLQVPVYNIDCYGCYNGKNGPPNPAIVQNKCRDNSFRCITRDMSGEVTSAIEELVCI